MAKFPRGRDEAIKGAAQCSTSLAKKYTTPPLFLRKLSVEGAQRTRTSGVFRSQALVYGIDSF